VAGLILETTFLVDLERSLPEAHRLLQRHAQDRFYITPTIAGEVAAGGSMRARPDWENFIGAFHIMAIEDEAAWQYGVTYRYLQANGMLIGTNDLWIASVGLANNLPVVTRNVRDFARIPGLNVIGY
jgi:predicted nucleic acid-binding protein